MRSFIGNTKPPTLIAYTFASFCVLSHPHTRFCGLLRAALDTLEIGDSIGDLTKEEVYKYRLNFYTRVFKSRKFSFKKEADNSYRVWRVA